ncbi:MAG: aldolase/citrate lyase family protein [Nitrososphaerota archaeon]
MRENRLREKLMVGKPCVGTFATIPNPAVVELIALSGFDFVIIDMEHGILNYESVENMVRAGDVHGLTSIVRVRENRESDILSALETGAQGVEVPHVESAEDAQRAVGAAKYAPMGMRGVSPYTRAGGYSSIPPHEHFLTSNRETMIVLHIEGREGVENMDSILRVEGVDVLFAGPYDLSQAYGVPGDVEDPKVLGAINKLIERCGSRGRWAGTFAPDVDKARRWITAGIKYVAYSVDSGIFYNALKQALDDIRG